MNTCILALSLIESVANPAPRIGFTIPLLLLIGAGVPIYRRCDQWFGCDPEVIVIIWSGLTVVVLAVLCEFWFG
jgi:hypothetical protein